MLGDAIFRALIEGLPDAIVITDRDGTILGVNAQTEALFGYEREELLDQSIDLLVPAAVRGRHADHRTRYVGHPGTRPMGIGLELSGQRKDGMLFPVEISLSPLVRGGEMYITSVIRDVSERHRLRSELEMRDERQRIAMDLHDGTIQSIYAIGLGLELALDDVVSEPVQAGRQVEQAIGQLNDVIGDIRAYIFDLRPVEFGGDLLRELDASIDEFRASSSLRVVADLPLSGVTLGEDAALAVLRVAREALSNARKHAQASEIRVSVTVEDRVFGLEIRDDGIGFDDSVLLGERHRGLRNMRERVQRLGGTFDVQSARAAGTTLRARLPVGA